MLGIMSGRLSSKIDNCIQAFPHHNWENEFSIAKSFGFQVIEWIYEDKNKFEEAEKTYLTIVQHGSKVPQVYQALAQLYGRNREQLNQAVSYAQKAIKLSPESASYYNTLALIYFRLGDYLQAESAIKKALSFSPENSVYQEGWRQIQQKLDR